MKAKAYAAGTILNALALFKGSAFGIELITEVRIEVEDGVGECMVVVNGREIKSNVTERLMRQFGKKGYVEVTSEIPSGSGLGSSSAYVNALICALLKENGENLDARTILSMNSRISLETGISYTGAFDDAAASLLGGFVVSDNRKLKLYRWDTGKYVESMTAAILIPEFDRKEVNWRKIREESNKLEEVLPELLNGKYCNVMRKNTEFYCRILGYPLNIAEKGWRESICCGLSGNGPCYVAFGAREDIKKIEEIWGEYGSVIQAPVSSKPAEKVEIRQDLFID
jgi:shikimate kinase